MMSERVAKIQSLVARSVICALAALSAACTAWPPRKPDAPPVAVAAPPAKADSTALPEPRVKPVAPPPSTVPTAPGASFRKAAWSELPGWRQDDVAEAWSAFLASCTALKEREFWREACAAAARTVSPAADAARAFFEQQFTPYQVTSAESGDDGLITGYYEPLLRGSRKPGGRYRYPLYGVPDDLVVVDLGELYPELRNMRLRGRLEGRRLVPYPARAEIDSAQAPLRGREIAWVDDAIDLFFLHIQGSGRVLLDSGETIRVGYADQNGHPYRSVGRLLVERGELTLEQASMQSIKAWGRANPERLADLLNSNASYVFFRELPATSGGPPGALGVPLTARRSIAVDQRFVPLGSPVYIATTWPNTTRPLNRLMLAQDTGGAIRGAVRADFFWGYGEAAGREAGRMKQRLRMWLLLPNGLTPPGGEAAPG